jgi:hypothetical protein
MTIGSLETGARFRIYSETKSEDDANAKNIVEGFDDNIL